MNKKFTVKEINQKLSELMEEQPDFFHGGDVSLGELKPLLPNNE